MIKQANILVVDDEEAIREAIKDSLSDLGLESYFKPLTEMKRLT